MSPRLSIVLLLGIALCMLAPLASASFATRPMAAQDKMPCDACIAKLVGKGVPADDAPKICTKVLKCIPNDAVPTQAAPTQAAPTKPARPTRPARPTKPAKPTTATPVAPNPMGVEAAEDKMPCDACIAKLTAKEVPADDAAKICMKVLKCIPNAVPTQAAPTKAAPTTAAPAAPTTAAPAAPTTAAPAAPTAATPVAPTAAAPVAPTAAAPAAPTDAPVAPTAAAPSMFPTAPPPPSVAFNAAINVPCDKCIAEGVEHGADADDAAFVCQVCNLILRSFRQRFLFRCVL
jgi:hypothetical protein